MYNKNMLNNNAYKTSLMFLGIIFSAIVLRMFLVEDKMFVQEEPTELANIICIFNNNC